MTMRVDFRLSCGRGVGCAIAGKQHRTRSSLPFRGNALGLFVTSKARPQRDPPASIMAAPHLAANETSRYRSLRNDNLLKVPDLGLSRPWLLAES